MNMVVKFLAKIRARGYKKFFRALWVDMKVRMGEDAIFPTNLQETLNMLYPELPSYDQCFNRPPKELAERVFWTIDPREHGLHIRSNRLRKRGKK